MSEQSVGGSGEAIEIFAALPRRFPVLEHLEGEPASKRELVSRADVSRTTIDRAIRELETLGLVTYEDGTYRLTQVGEVVANETGDLLEHIAVAEELQPFLRWVPVDELGLDLRALAGAEVLLPEDGDPYAMINRHVEFLGEMDRCVSLLPFTGLHAVEAGTRRVLEGASGELVVEPQVAETFRSDPQYAELIDEAVATGRLTVYETAASIPFGLSVIDGTVQIVAADGEQPRALLQTDAPAAVSWARSTFEEYRVDATPIE